MFSGILLLVKFRILLISEDGKLIISAVNVKYSFILVATFSEFVIVSLFIINTSGRALADAFVFLPKNALNSLH